MVLGYWKKALCQFSPPFFIATSGLPNVKVSRFKKLVGVVQSGTAFSTIDDGDTLMPKVVLGCVSADSCVVIHALYQRATLKSNEFLD